MTSSTEKVRRYGPLEVDPRAAGMSPREFNRKYLQCNILDGTRVQLREYCPDLCLGTEDVRCPRREDLGDEMGMFVDDRGEEGLPREDIVPVAPEVRGLEAEAPPDGGDREGATEVEVTHEVEVNHEVEVHTDHLEPEDVDASHDTEPEDETPDDDVTESPRSVIKPAEPVTLLMAPPMDLRQAIDQAPGSDLDPAKVEDERIAAWILEATNHAQHGLARAILVGRALAARKAVLAHGKFGRWLEELGTSGRSARVYMQLAQAYDQNGSTLPISPGTSIREALRQLQAPKDDDDSTGAEGPGENPPEPGETNQAPDEQVITPEVPNEEETELTDAQRMTGLLRSVVEVVAELSQSERERWLTWLHDYLLPEKANTFVPKWSERDDDAR